MEMHVLIFSSIDVRLAYLEDMLAGGESESLGDESEPTGIEAAD